MLVKKLVVKTKIHAGVWNVDECFDGETYVVKEELKARRRQLIP